MKNNKSLLIFLICLNIFLISIFILKDYIEEYCKDKHKKMLKELERSRSEVFFNKTITNPSYKLIITTLEDVEKYEKLAKNNDNLNYIILCYNDFKNPISKYNPTSLPFNFEKIYSKIKKEFYKMVSIKDIPYINRNFTSRYLSIVSTFKILHSNEYNNITFNSRIYEKKISSYIDKSINKLEANYYRFIKDPSLKKLKDIDELGIRKVFLEFIEASIQNNYNKTIHKIFSNFKLITLEKNIIETPIIIDLKNHFYLYFYKKKVNDLIMKISSEIMTEFLVFKKFYNRKKSKKK